MATEVETEAAERDQADRIKGMSMKLLEAGVNSNPREYLAALAVTAAKFIEACYAVEQRPKVIVAHLHNIQSICGNEDLKKELIV